MLAVAYLANEFPSPVEPYVADEIEELRRRGVRVIPASVRKSRMAAVLPENVAPEPELFPLRPAVLARALGLCIRKWNVLQPLILRVAFQGKEGLLQRLKALVHTFLGACYAVTLDGRSVDHIHVHHGFFGSWIAMTAARLLGVGFSMTLHGSDLLVHGAYLDVKLANCAFCLTISEYNRLYIADRHPESAEKVMVARLGVNVPEPRALRMTPVRKAAEPFSLLAVGRLHAVKDHAFLVRACAELALQEIPFECTIAGEGPERRHLESLIREFDLERQVNLLGHIPRGQMDSLYARADVIVLTSRSEGIPLVLMEAMARGKIVLAPAITGIPELVIAGKTGFLYEPGAMDDFVDRLIVIRSLMAARNAGDPANHSSQSPVAERLDWIRHAGRVQVLHNFNRTKNLDSFCDLFLRRIRRQTEAIPDESLVLQQI